MTDYKGIKIPTDIILVERLNDKNEISQAYVVDKGNSKMLKNALNWASTSLRKKDENGEYIKIPNECRPDYPDYDWYKVDGIQHEYKNGNFQIELLEAADGSSQGGKLSFWNCKLITPDNKEFSVGINSELLIDILKHNTWVDGRCQNKNIWLGRVKGTQVGVFTKNLENFKQALEDEKQRTAKKSSSYKPGMVVKTLTNTNAYAGELYKLYDVKYDSSYYWYRDSYKPEVVITIYKKPKKVYGFLNHDWQDSSKWQMDSIEIQKNKQAKIFTGETIEINLKEILKAQFDKQISYIKSDLERCTLSLARNYRDFFYLFMYSLDYKSLSTENLIALIEKQFKEMRNSEFPFYMFKLKYIEK